MLQILWCDKDGNLHEDTSQDKIPDLISSDTGIAWVKLQVESERDIQILSEIFKFHPLTIEDCISPNTRPKVDNFDDYLFIVLRSVDFNPQKIEIERWELHLYLGKNYVVSVCSDLVRSLQTATDRITKNPQIMTKGSDFVLHTIIDTVVDEYFPVIEYIDEIIDQIEDEIFENIPPKEILSKIFSLKREVLYLRRILGPQRDLINLLARGDFSLIRGHYLIFFRDIYDHIARIYEVTENNRDMLLGALETFLSMTSNRLNQVMKVLTAIATIMMPLTLMVGIYGMNFENMPELHWKYGYFVCLGVMFGIGIFMLAIFKKKEWF